MIKLNLGCGIYYKPGYINIDMFESEIADVVTDIRHLQYEDNGVDDIEASHILEHFDVITLPFLIAEWFRVLKPNGKLVIEAPNFFKGYLRLLTRNNLKKRNTLRFLFGVDLPGNTHKIGLIPKFLKDILISTGFVHVNFIKSQSFKDQKSFRIIAQKPEKISLLDKKGLTATFRWMIYNEFKEFDVLFLDAVEKNCINVIEKQYDYDNRDFFSIKNIVSMIALFSLFHPKIAKIFLSLLPKVRVHSIKTEILDYLEKINSPTIFLSVWMKWKKEEKDLILNFTRFQDYWIDRLSKFLTTNTNNENISDTFTYLSNTQGEDCDYFSLEVIDIKSLKLTNLGIKSFASKDHNKSYTFFKKSLDFVPNNALNNWNLARLSILLDERKYKTLNYYHQALMQEKDRKIYQLIKNELLNFSHNNSQIKIENPIQIRN
ncbi:methyltransferase domain-containing protein [Promethearchaeum syntrophicum]|uniref:Methyltransferase domain-containing protein n=1 Tax=Promethearchaeum syntrophicum TaxID=2594042 RepID=A0A5B9DAA8_9ARCH|nr:methyltransferase domain-containing protein [Candidatus Prometheoarchaeum syntrophicum]QEE16169.1 Methyltransferase domain protein [Candidatus Prometheoarchaeum syntrophicum]